MDTLIASLNNPTQKEIVTKLQTRNEYSQIYLSEFRLVNEKNAIASLELLGSYNYTKRTRELYNMKIYNSGKCTFWCSCPFQKFQSSKTNSVCKHICFLVCKVGRIYDASFFETKILNTTSLDSLIAKLQSNDIWKDTTLTRTFKTISKSDFTNSTKPKDDLCPICYEDLDISSNIVNCPTCENHVHDACVQVWLEKNQTCVYCRSDIWQFYSKVQTGEIVRFS
jgi:hypothetical protein